MHANFTFAKAIFRKLFARAKWGDRIIYAAFFLGLFAGLIAANTKAFIFLYAHNLFPYWGANIGVANGVQIAVLLFIAEFNVRRTAIFRFIATSEKSRRRSFVSNWAVIFLVAILLSVLVLAVTRFDFKEIIMAAIGCAAASLICSALISTFFALACPNVRPGLLPIGSARAPWAGGILKITRFRNEKAGILDLSNIIFGFFLLILALLMVAMLHSLQPILIAMVIFISFLQVQIYQIRPKDFVRIFNLPLNHEKVVLKDILTFSLCHISIVILSFLLWLFEHDIRYFILCVIICVVIFVSETVWLTKFNQSGRILADTQILQMFMAAGLLGMIFLPLAIIPPAYFMFKAIKGVGA